MGNATGRLDVLAMGILERLAQRDPVASAMFRLFEPQIRTALRALDVPAVRAAVRDAAREQAAVEAQSAAGSRALPRTASEKRRRKRISSAAAVTVTGADGKSQVVEAEWIQ